MAMKVRDFQQRSWGWKVREAKATDHMLKEDRDLLAARFEERCLAWEKARRHGMAFYVFTHGTLRFGGIVALSILVFDYWLFPNRPPVGKALCGFALLLVIATVEGLWEWHSNEKRYHKK